MADKPVKPYYITFTNYISNTTKFFYCGACGELETRILRPFDDKFCRRCGTPIDWSEPLIRYNEKYDIDKRGWRMKQEFEEERERLRKEHEEKEQRRRHRRRRPE